MSSHPHSDWQDMKTLPTDRWVWVQFGIRHPEIAALQWNTRMRMWQCGTGYWNTQLPFTCWCEMDTQPPPPAVQEPADVECPQPKPTVAPIDDPDRYAWLTFHMDNGHEICRHDGYDECLTCGTTFPLTPVRKEGNADVGADVPLFQGPAFQEVGRQLEQIVEEVYAKAPKRVVEHHPKCPACLAWDIPNVPCECPRGWPRKTVAESK